MNEVNLFSVKLGRNKTSSVIPIRLPLDLVLSLHREARARKTSLNALANECMKAGFQQVIESEVKQAA